MMCFHTSDVKEECLNKPVISSIAPLSATDSLYRLIEDISCRRPAAASQVESEPDLRRFTVRFKQPRNCIMASIYYFPTSEYFPQCYHRRHQNSQQNTAFPGVSPKAQME